MGPLVYAGFSLAAIESGIIVWLLIRLRRRSPRRNTRDTEGESRVGPEEIAAVEAPPAAPAQSTVIAAATELPVELDTTAYEHSIIALFESILRYLNSTSEPMSETLVRIKTVIADFLASVDRSRSTFDSLECASRMKEGIDKLWTHIADMTDRTSRSFNAFSQEIDRLSSLMSSITELLSSISDIAERVHILSINASIEAARAGAHGHGFKVIANEIQKLSGETQSFVGTIGTTITKTQEMFRSLRSVTQDTQALVSKQVNEDSSLYDGMHNMLQKQLDEFTKLYSGVARFIESIEMDMKALFPLSMLHAIITQEIENTEKCALDFVQVVRETQGDAAALVRACGPEETVERMRKRLTTSRELEALDSAVRKLGLQDKIDLKRTDTDMEFF